eukprot:5670206-Amphidinium_carterae.3
MLHGKENFAPSSGVGEVSSGEVGRPPEERGYDSDEDVDGEEALVCASNASKVHPGAGAMGDGFNPQTHSNRQSDVSDSSAWRQRLQMVPVSRTERRKASACRERMRK